MDLVIPKKISIFVKIFIYEKDIPFTYS